MAARSLAVPKQPKPRQPHSAKEGTPGGVTWAEAIKKAIATSLEPLTIAKISSIIQVGGFRSTGANPTQAIFNELNKASEANPFRKVAPGLYALKDVGDSAPAPVPNAPVVVLAEDPEAEDEDVGDIITAIGMYWQRDLVHWGAKPKMAGIQKNGSVMVDFCDQIGIYLLYDGREVIYVGRTDKRRLGTRILEHTKDRFAARWDRFSWFGLLPVRDNGTFDELPVDFPSQKMPATLEAVLIEAMEPRQNRRRGDNIEDVEYLQQPDPSIEKKRKKEMLRELSEKI